MPLSAWYFSTDTPCFCVSRSYLILDLTNCIGSAQENLVLHTDVVGRVVTKDSTATELLVRRFATLRVWKASWCLANIVVYRHALSGLQIFSLIVVVVVVIIIIIVIGVMLDIVELDGGSVVASSHFGQDASCALWRRTAGCCGLFGSNLGVANQGVLEMAHAHVTDLIMKSQDPKNDHRGVRTTSIISIDLSWMQSKEAYIKQAIEN
jgi:hypothetical protein